MKEIHRRKERVVRRGAPPKEPQFRKLCGEKTVVLQRGAQPTPLFILELEFDQTLFGRADLQVLFGKRPF